MLYQHTQRGTVIVGVCLSIGVLGAAIIRQSGAISMIPFLIILIAIAVVFHALTVEVEDNELRWYFGLGLWTYRLAIDEIRSLAVVRNRWWNGFGIRTAPGMRLYNVSGLHAVELRLKSGDIRRIGTDDPEGLAAALASAAGGRLALPYSSR